MINHAPLQWLAKAAEINDEVRKIHAGLSNKSGGCSSCAINAAVARAKKLLADAGTPEAQKALAVLDAKPTTGTVSPGNIHSPAMYCPDCLRKHLAAALSYGKEIVNGHGHGGTPDHRPDFAGEVINAEHHAETINVELATALRELRHGLDNVQWTPEIADLDRLRELWSDSLNLKLEN